MKFQTMTTLILSLFVSTSVFAAGGDELGNGGDILVCREGDKASYNTFDLMDPVVNAGLTRRDFSEATSEYEIEADIIEKLRQKDPERACLYWSWMQDFFQQKRAMSSPLTEIGDEGVTLIPNNCSLQQLIVQYKHRDEGKYSVNLNLYRQLSSLDRVAIRFHEVIYREKLAVKSRPSPKDSLAVRRMTAYLFSKNFAEATTEQHKAFVSSLGHSTSENFCNLNHMIYSK